MCATAIKNVCILKWVLNERACDFASTAIRITLRANSYSEKSKKKI